MRHNPNWGIGYPVDAVKTVKQDPVNNSMINSDTKLSIVASVTF